jgi:hypothetical protein
MRRYVLTYLRGGLAVMLLAGAVLLVRTDILASAMSVLPLWVAFVLLFLSFAVPMTGSAIFIGTWQRRFRNVARDLEILPPTFAQYARVQSAAARGNRATAAARASLGLLVAVCALILMIYEEANLGRWQTALMACAAVGGLAYYVWCRAVMRAAREPAAPGGAEPAPPGDGEGGDV